MRNQTGFTIIELVVVIVIIGILSVVVTQNWTATPINLNFEANRLLNDIRYTQALSVTSGQRYRFVRLTANSYQITNENGVAVRMPSGSTSVTFNSGITFAPFVNLPNSLMAFNSQGTPYTTSTSPGTALAATAIISLQAGTQIRSLSITPQTGYAVLN